MCLNPKRIKREGYYKEKRWNGLEGEHWEIDSILPCGWCEQCQANKSNNWIVRNSYEEKRHVKKCFITLTYADPNIKFLLKKDLQDFMKRLRQNLKRKAKFKDKIRCFYCGEYGSQKTNFKPHYHIIIYGWEEEKENLTLLGFNKKNKAIYLSNIIDKTWKRGRTTYQNFNFNEIPYISMYLTPKEELGSIYKANRNTLKAIYNNALNELKKHEDLKFFEGLYRRYRKAILKPSNLENSKEIADFKLFIKNVRESAKNVIKDLKKWIESESLERKDYRSYAEFNGWSKSLGWEEFEKNFTSNYNFEEYVNDKIFPTPNPWIKKLANLGIENARQEMFKRQALAKEKYADLTVGEIQNKNKLHQISKKSKEIEEWIDKKEIEIL